MRLSECFFTIYWFSCVVFRFWHGVCNSKARNLKHELEKQNLGVPIMKTLNNIVTLALFASMTIACGASTQASDSAFSNLSIPAVAPVGTQEGTLVKIDAEPQPAVAEVGSTDSDTVGAAAVNARNLSYCPEGFTGLAKGCESRITNRVPRPTIQHAQAEAFTAMPEMNQGENFGAQSMGGHGF